jgi:uncharacterized protein (DUF488 family)
MDVTIFTLGYQGIGIGEYIETLREKNVGMVLDVRETPWSYKKDFSRSTFREHLATAGLGYEHVQSAGNPAENRKTALSSQESLARYREYLEAHLQCVHELLGHARTAHDRGYSVCLTCFEKNWHECHRSVLTDVMQRFLPELEVCHLEASQNQLSLGL